MFSRFTHALYLVATLGGPAISIFWGMALLCFWFDPARGSLYSSGLIRLLPKVGHAAVRWYFAIFLVIWFLFGIIVWPVFSLGRLSWV